MRDSHRDACTLSNEKRIEAAMVLMSLHNPVTAIAQNTIKPLSKSHALIDGRGKMIYLGPEGAHLLLETAFPLVLHDEVKNDFCPVHMAEITEEIPLNPSLAKVVYYMKNSERHHFSPSTAAMLSLACPSP